MQLVYKHLENMKPSVLHAVCYGVFSSAPLCGPLYTDWPSLQNKYKEDVEVLSFPGGWQLTCPRTISLDSWQCPQHRKLSKGRRGLRADHLPKVGVGKTVYEVEERLVGEFR